MYIDKINDQNLPGVKAGSTGEQPAASMPDQLNLN
jgi:hypothetical protein